MRDINIYSEDKVISRLFVRENMNGLLDLLDGYSRVFVIVDANVASKSEVWTSLSEIFAQKSIPILPISVSEEKKDLETVSLICTWLLESNADRSSLVVAVGGGITTDIVGFAASIYKRGVRFAFVPTTLLAMVDASIGGKTGVNYQGYKNILGIISQPKFTYVCPIFLSSLSKRDFLSGAAELLKTFIIEDNGHYLETVKLLYEMHAEEEFDIRVDHYVVLTHLIAAADAVKAAIVTLDQFEKGERRKLNLGHTFAHAIEKCAQSSNMDISHGEAVAMGIILAADFSDRRYDTALRERFVRDFRACGLPVECPFPLSTLAGPIFKDKKVEGNTLHLVLVRSIGDTIVEDVPIADIVAFLNSGLLNKS